MCELYTFFKLFSAMDMLYFITLTIVDVMDS